MRLPYPEPELSDGVVTLRRWRYDDRDCIRLAATDPRIPTGTTVPALYTDAEGDAFIERQWSRQTNGEGLSLAIATTSTDQAVGLIVALLRPEPGMIGIGYWLVPPHRGHHYARRAVALLTRWLVERSDIVRIEAMVDPENTASRRTLEACGFEQEGLLGGYLVYSRP